MLNANENSEKLDPKYYSSKSRRRSKLQRIILEAVAAAHREKSGKGYQWIESREIASAAAKQYGGQVKSEFQPHSWWTNYKLTGSFRAAFSRSLKTLVEQGAIERRATRVRLPLKQWQPDWIDAVNRYHEKSLAEDKDKAWYGYVVSAAEEWDRDLEAVTYIARPQASKHSSKT